MVRSALDGISGHIFCYGPVRVLLFVFDCRFVLGWCPHVGIRRVPLVCLGPAQVGGGKTYTMFGSGGAGVSSRPMPAAQGVCGVGCLYLCVCVLFCTCVCVSDVFLFSCACVFVLYACVSLHLS